MKRPKPAGLSKLYEKKMALLRWICLYKEANKWKKWCMIRGDHIWMPYSKHSGLALKQTISLAFNINMITGLVFGCWWKLARAWMKCVCERTDFHEKEEGPHLMSTEVTVQHSKHTWPSGYSGLLYHGLQ